MTNPFPPQFFERVDDEPDDLFYALPRFVNHVDDATIEALTAYLELTLRPGDRILDLMSSWVSHLPEYPFTGVTCLGMNAEELAANPRADEQVVHDLNRTPALPFQSCAFEAVLISFSVQYLLHPLEVFSEVGRVLSPGGTFLIALSHRCFPTKAIRLFRSVPASRQIEFLRACVTMTGDFESARFDDASTPNADPLWIVRARRRIVPGDLGPRQ